MVKFSKKAVPRPFHITLLSLGMEYVGHKCSDMWTKVVSALLFSAVCFLKGVFSLNGNDGMFKALGGLTEGNLEHAIPIIKLDDATRDVYTARRNAIIRQHMPGLTIVEQYDLESDVVLLELIRHESNIILFYCLKGESPSCSIKNVTSKNTTAVDILEKNDKITNFLHYSTVRTHMFTTQNTSPSVRLLSVARDVGGNTHHTFRNAIALFEIDLEHLTMRIHKGNGHLSVVMVGSPFVLKILHAFHFHQRMYYLASHPKDKAFPSVNVLIQIDMWTGNVVESPIDCVGESESIGTTSANLTEPGRQPLLLTLHRKITTNEATVCTTTLSTLEHYFSQVFSGNKTTSNTRSCTHGHCVFHTPGKNETYAEEHAATTLFMSQATPFFSMEAEPVDVTITESSDNVLAHVLTRDAQITTVKLWNNSQVVSVDNVTNIEDISSLVNYDNMIYVCDSKEMRRLDVSRCDRHLSPDTCLREVADCSWCSNVSSDVSSDVTTRMSTTEGQNVSTFCSSTPACQYSVTTYTGHPPGVSGIDPSWGPKSGGNLLAISGEQLDMAVTLNVTIAGKVCRIIKSSIVRSGFHCVVPACDAYYVPSLVDVIVHTDATVYSYQYTYEPDPSISDFYPKRSITSGGTMINITGDNLSRTWDKLYLVFAEPEASYTSMRFPCDVTPVGVSCVTPPIETSFSNTMQRMRLSLGVPSALQVSEGLLLTQPIQVQIEPDPVIHDFFLKVLSSAQEDVVFEGMHLDSVEPSEISVVDIYNPSLFIITNVTATEIHCRLTRKISDASFVKVTIGNNLVFYPGMAIHRSVTSRPEPETSPSPVEPVQNQQQPEVSDSSLSVIITVIVLCLVIAGIAVVVTVMKRRNRKNLGHQRPSIVSFHSSMGVVIGDRVASRSLSNASMSDVLLSTEASDEIAREIIRRLEEERLIIKRANLTLQKMIGRGNFGSVFKGILKTADASVEVAVKTLHQDEPRDMDIQLFLKEAYVMKDFRHANVMTLVGICLDLDEMPLVVTPYMQHGDMLTYLHEDKHIPTVKDLVSYGLDIARGMTYLAQLKFVHRDLAARNCMLDSTYTVKVADFGLSRDIYESSYYSARSKGTKLPVKWMAIDSLTNGVFNEKTDVWSYGVTLWELMTRGVRPYATVDNWDMERYLNSGRRLPQPLYCPNQLYRVMRKCWAEDPDERPPFEELEAIISEMLDRVHHNLGNADRATNIQTTYVNLAMGASYHYENEAVFRDEAAFRNETVSE